MSDTKNAPTKPAAREEKNVVLVDEKGNESTVTKTWYERNEESFKTAGLKPKK